MKTYMKGALMGLVLSATVVNAQNNPTPFNLNASGNYSFSTWASTSPSGTYPANMIFHLLNTTNPPVTAVAQSDLLSGYSYAYTSGTRIQGLGESGVQFQNATSPVNAGYTANKLGEAVLGLVTSQRTNIQLTWKAQTKTTAGNVMAIRCQYRIGSSGAYTDFAPMSEYMSSTTLNDSAVFNVTLPSNLDNLPLVQIRWIYYRVSGAASSSRTIRLDDIAVTSQPLVTLSQHADVCINAAPFAITDGSPAGGVYSGTGVVNGNTFDPSVSGTGTFLITYTYTDANGISNSASVNIVVSTGACVIPIGLAAGSCGATGLLKNSYIYTESAPNAQNYEYEFSGGDLSAPVFYQRGNWYTDFNLIWIPALNYGQTYDVRVRARVSGIWGSFANFCSISLAAVPPVPQLAASSCGATGLALNSYIYTTQVAGAQDYEYRFVNTSTSAVSTRTRGNWYTDFNLSWPGTLQYGATYDVTVRAKINGVWGAFGPVCQISTQAFPVTQLTTASCGSTNLMPSDRIYANPVAGAQNYRYLFTPVPSGTPMVRLRNSSATDLVLGWVTGLQANTTYNVQVAAYAGGSWGPWGDVCQITTSASYMPPLVENNPNERVMEESSAPVVSTVLMYPNPVTDDVLHLNIEGTTEDPAGMIEVYDMTGRLVISQQVTLMDGTTLVDVNLAELGNGVYMVRVRAGDALIDQQNVIRQ